MKRNCPSETRLLESRLCLEPVRRRIMRPSTAFFTVETLLPILFTRRSLIPRRFRLFHRDRFCEDTDVTRRVLDFQTGQQSAPTVIIISILPSLFPFLLCLLR